MEFSPFPKIARWYRDIVVSEKIDGSNAAIYIEEQTDEEAERYFVEPKPGVSFIRSEYRAVTVSVRAASRSRFVTPASDNFGFATWVHANAFGLSALGPGVHFGEWWGRGIQRGYGKTDRTFSLFNVGRWYDPSQNDSISSDELNPVPGVPGLSVVPVLYRGPIKGVHVSDPVGEALRRLQYSGSLAKPGFMNAEGVIVWHEAGRFYMKATLDGDGHKGV